MVTIFSGDYSASIKPFGAELCSVKQLTTNIEFVWQADSIWPRHAPVLFPFVGRLRNFQYRFNGESYTIEQHGFARDLDFKVIEHLENKVTFELTENQYTLQRYPFLFRLRITYLLEANQLTMSFEVINTGNSTMPVTFGAHPAFAISAPSDVFIQFESDANPKSWVLDGSYISNKTKSVTDGKGTIEITNNTFTDDALIFKFLNSKWVKLISPNDNKEIKFSLEGWPYLGIWAKPGAPFVCIEPWQGLADDVDFDGEVTKKEGMFILSSNELIQKSFKMEFNQYR